MKNPFPLLASIGMVIFFAACSNPNQQLIDEAPLISQRFTDAYGNTHMFSRTPTRVVSLSSSITEIVYAIGADKKLVAVSHDSDYPKPANSKPYIITYPEFDLPSVATQYPDLVLASTEIHDERISEYFKRYKIPLHFQNYAKVEDIFDAIRTIGSMLSAETKANQLADSLAAQTKLIADSTAGQIHYKTAMILGIDPLTVVGSNSYLDDLLEKAGGKNAFGEIVGKYPEITAAEFIKAAPEYVLVLSRNDKAWNDLIALHPELHTQIPATELNHIFQVDPEILVRPGPRIVEGLAYITRILHPKVQVPF